MSSHETKKGDNDTQEMANMLAWPGAVEDGVVTAGALREVQEHEDRLRRNSGRDRISSPFTAGQKLYGILSVGLVVLSVLFFFWLVWIFVQKLTFGPP